MKEWQLLVGLKCCFYREFVSKDPSCRRMRLTRGHTEELQTTGAACASRQTPGLQYWRWRCNENIERCLWRAWRRGEARPVRSRWYFAWRSVRRIHGVISKFHSVQCMRRSPRNNVDKKASDAWEVLWDMQRLSCRLWWRSLGRKHVLDERTVFMYERLLSTSTGRLLLSFTSQGFCCVQRTH